MGTMGDYTDRARMREQFGQLLQVKLLKKSHNCQSLTKERYDQLIVKVKEAKVKTKKDRDDYRRAQRFDTTLVDGTEKLIMPVVGGCELMFYAHNDELFDILHEAHLRIGHGGRTRMEKELNRKYRNITKEMITLYLTLCKPCRLKLIQSKRGALSKPSRPRVTVKGQCRVQLIDMQSMPDGDFKFILNYQDQETKFTLLRAMKDNTVDQVAEHLLDIFTTFGAPSALLSDHGHEFATQVIEALKLFWPELQIAYVKQRQGSGQSSERGLLDMMTTWQQSNQSSHWATSLKFIQFMKNRTFHQGLRQTPHEAMFGSRHGGGPQGQTLTQSEQMSQAATEGHPEPSVPHSP